MNMIDEIILSVLEDVQKSDMSEKEMAQLKCRMIDDRRSILDSALRMDGANVRAMVEDYHESKLRLAMMEYIKAKSR